MFAKYSIMNNPLEFEKLVMTPITPALPAYTITSFKSQQLCDGCMLFYVIRKCDVFSGWVSLSIQHIQRHTSAIANLSCDTREDYAGVTTRID